MSNLDDLIDRTHFDYEQNETKAKQLEERILKVPGIPKKLAEDILTHLKKWVSISTEFKSQLEKDNCFHFVIKNILTIN